MKKRIAERDLTVVKGKAWGLNVILVLADGRKIAGELTIEPVLPVKVVRSEYSSMPLFRLNGGWNADGIRPRELIAQCATLCQSMNLETLRVEDEEGTVFQFGFDYIADPQWCIVGRLEGGRIQPEEKVFLSFTYQSPRLDSLVLQTDNTVCQKPGRPDSLVPKPAPTAGDEELIGRIYFSGKQHRLTDEMVFPLVEETFNDRLPPDIPERLLPQTLKKLRTGGPFRLLAWGDSVTAGEYLPEAERWPNRLAAFLHEQYPEAEIELVNRGWGGRTTMSFMNEPPGSPYNYLEKIVNSDADLVVTEFVNDGCVLTEKQFHETYARIRTDFRARNMEWLILTPHLIRPDWMGSVSAKGYEDDPRPYVWMLRKFASDNSIPLADAAKRYCHLWKEAIPHDSLMVNAINHPDERGMTIFLEALKEFFQK